MSSSSISNLFPVFYTWIAFQVTKILKTSHTVFIQFIKHTHGCVGLFRLSSNDSTRKPVGFMQSCCFVFNGNETKTCLLCHSYLFGMNNVLYIE